MNKMRVIAAYGEYEVGLTIHGCIYLKDGEGYDFNVDSAFDALHLIEDKQARFEMAKQIAPLDFTPGEEEKVWDKEAKEDRDAGSLSLVAVDLKKDFVPDLDEFEVQNLIDNAAKALEGGN